MVGASTAFFLFALIHGSSASTMLSEKESVMRREQRKSVQMTATGTLIKDEPKKPKTLVNTQGELSSEDLSDLAAEFCDYDFLMGKDDSSNCSDAGKHALILEESMCVEASVEAGATSVRDSFGIPSEWEDRRPEGCFKYECAEAPNKVCYFYNEDGDTPTKPKGSPVCSRPKYLNGTKDTNGGCPDGYAVIINEDSCSATANCLGYAAAAEFRIGTRNASHTLEYPLGCFIHSGDGHVYFNKKGALHTGANEEGGTSVKGINICQVAKTVHWDASGKDAAPAAAATTAGATAAEATTDKKEDKKDDKKDVKEKGTTKKEDKKGTTKKEDKKDVKKPDSLSEVQEHVQNMDSEDAQDLTSDNPCSNIGCNSLKCAWASGGVVSRLTAKKSCSNSKLLGSQEVTMLKDQAKVTTLKECMHQGADCTETTNEKICRYQVLEE